jgi:predicted nucleic acid-binding protein
MRRVFADTSYWLASFLPNDQWAAAAECSPRAGSKVELLTCEEVLGEFLAAVARYGPETRKLAVELIEQLRYSQYVTVLKQSHESFIAGVQVYKERLDKEYSLVDCVAMRHMKDHDIPDILTADHHFKQEGFIALMITQA